MITITIPGEMRGKGRPRFARRGAHVSTYSDDKTRNMEAWVKSCAVSAMPCAPLDGPVSLVMEVCLGVPPSWGKRKRLDAISGALMPTCKPDLDNCLKLVGDACNGIVWQDDRQIVRAVVFRRYAEAALTILTVCEA